MFTLAFLTILGKAIIYFSGSFLSFHNINMDNPSKLARMTSPLLERSTDQLYTKELTGNLENSQTATMTL